MLVRMWADEEVCGIFQSPSNVKGISAIKVIKYGDDRDDFIIAIGHPPYFISKHESVQGVDS